MSPHLYNHHHGNVPPNAIYIGRGTRRLARSKWANPFVIDRDGTREEVIEKFRVYLYESGLIDDIGELVGKDLVCWCVPQSCHGTILLEAAARSAGAPFGHRRRRKHVPEQSGRAGGNAA